MGQTGQPADSQARVSRTERQLTRPVSFKYLLDVTPAQHERLLMYAGARRFTYNHHVARIKHNLDVRAVELSAGVPEEKMTPALSWSRFSFINHFNAWKNGTDPEAPINEDGSRGLLWRNEVSTDVFECAAVDAAHAFAAFSKSKNGQRAGARVGFPQFQKKGKVVPTFRLRSKEVPGNTPPIRFHDRHTIRVPRLDELRIHGSGKKVQRMIETGRFRVYSATFTYRAGRWWISLNGVAAPFHHQQRSSSARSQTPVGVDLGVKTLATVAGADGEPIAAWEGVKALETSLRQLRRANKALARTTPGSRQNAIARRRLNRLHAQIANIRRHEAHQFTTWLVRNHQTITVEDLNVAGMVRMRSLARRIGDAGMGDLVRLLTYKADWYGVDLHVADRWYPSSKTCSGCETVKTDLTLSDRTYRCDSCGLVVDRDVNAAINLARWPARSAPPLTVAA